MIDSRPRAKQGSLIVNVVIDIEYIKLEHLLHTTTRPKMTFYQCQSSFMTTLV